MSSQIASLGDKTNLRDIFRILENQNSAIFNSDHDAYSASITTCLKKLVELISPDDKDYLEDLKYFIHNGVCRVANNYDADPKIVTPVVLNFLMTAIRSYNHINALSKASPKASPRSRVPYHVTLETCHGLSDTSSAFLVQVLAPYINSGARHVFPVDTPLHFNVVVKEKFIVRSPSPLEGNRVGSLATPVPFGEALKALKKANKANKSPKKGNKTPTKGNKSPGKSSDTDSSGSRSGGKTRRRRKQPVPGRHSTRR
jgi:hypothetical protein